jgi:hypothetical protein
MALFASARRAGPRLARVDRGGPADCCPDGCFGAISASFPAISTHE